MGLVFRFWVISTQSYRCFTNECFNGEFTESEVFGRFTVVRNDWLYSMHIGMSDYTIHRLV